MSRRALWLVGAGLVGLILALYLPFLGAPFEYDDKVEILQNRVLRTPGQLGPIWEYNPFRVLLMYTFSWDIWAWGILRPAPYRLENVLIHGSCSLVLLSLLRRLAPYLAPDWTAARRGLLVAGGALIFAVHPLAIESVTYISGRSTSLATLFVVVSAWAYLGYAHRVAEDPAVGQWLAARVRRLNVALGALLAAGLLVGLPVSWLVAHERMAPARGITIGLAGVAVLVAVLAAVGADRWRALAPPVVQNTTSASGRRAGNALLLSFVMFVLGTLTKEIAATLPAVLFLMEWIALRRGDGRGALSTLRGRLFPFFAIPAFLIALRVVAYGYIASPTPIRPWTDNLLTQSEVIPRYLGLWFVPFPQSIYHDHPTVLSPGTWSAWLGAAFVLGLLILAVRSRVAAPAAALGLLVAAVTLAPTSSVFALKESMVEHRLYLPSIGLALATSWLFAGPVWAAAARMGRSKPLIHATLPLLLWCAALAWENRAYQSLWGSEEELWNNALAVNPRATDAWRYLGDLYSAQGRWDDADRALGAAVALRPKDPELLNKLGRVRAINHDLEGAEKLFVQAANSDACHTPALNNLAALRKLQGNLAAAVDIYTDSIDCAPDDNYIAERSLGDIYYSDAELRDREKAGEHYTRALQALDPASPDAPLLKQRLLELTW
ncbi:MAG: tetratricopeptide repeat protein [Deltaproteobacteria bacterium]|nr:tetratricopeptide repeat protein [Deltaproteobacteria bacterium]